MGESTAEKVPKKGAARAGYGLSLSGPWTPPSPSPEDGSGKRPATRSFLSTSCSHLRAKPSLPRLTTFVSIRVWGVCPRFVQVLTPGTCACDLIQT